MDFEDSDALIFVFVIFVGDDDHNKISDYLQNLRIFYDGFGKMDPNMASRERSLRINILRINPTFWDPYIYE